MVLKCKDGLIKKRVAVVIPAYKNNLSKNEKISLTQCRKVLNKYDRYLLLPEGLQFGYTEDEKVVVTSAINMSSRKKYSDYVLSEEFYSAFSEYDYILIYQLDSFVFEDRLDYFCNLGYDYIGAEWIYGLECHAMDEKLWFFGNGGFSLRKVSAFAEWIESDGETVSYAKMLLPEDLAISIYGKDYLKIAGRDVAMEFSYDMHPEECYKMQGEKLPFGCHAWDRFDTIFWKRIIDSFGYDVELHNVNDAETMLLCTGKDRFKKLSTYFAKGKIYNCLDKLLTNWQGEISVFGAGQYGFSFINMIKETTVKIKCVIDNDPNKIGKNVEEIRIVNLREAIDSGYLPIIIALAETSIVEKQLIDCGLIKGKDYILSKELQNEMCRE